MHTNITLPPGLLYRGETHRAFKAYRHGTHRVMSPEETFERVRPSFKPLGITRVANITGLDHIGIPVTLAIRPNSPTLSNSTGKGLTMAAAMTSGAMEAIEHAHAETVTLPVIQKSYAEMSQDYAVLARRDLPLIKHHVFAEHLPVDWIFGWDIIQQQEVAIPRALVDLVPPDWNQRDNFLFFQMSSNGLASGNVFIEAVLAGLYEVVERDAIACHKIAWQVVNAPPPIIHLDSLMYPSVRDLYERLKAHGIHLILFDCSIETNVPVYMAQIHDESVTGLGVYRGYGCHLDPQVAMTRAITEAVQARVVYIAGSRDDMFGNGFRMMISNRNRHIMNQIVQQESYFVSADAYRFTDDTTHTLEGDLQVVLDRLVQADFNSVIVVDLTKDDIGIPVVCVFVPGMEGYLMPPYVPGYHATAFMQERAEQVKNAAH